MAFTFFGAIQEKPQYKITKPIRLIENFCGIGTQSMALRNLGANFERYRAYDFDKDAIKSYNAIHGTNFEPTDIKNVKGDDLGIVDVDKYEYLLTYSFPCFTADTLVLTNQGLKQIKDVSIVDNVMTHTGDYKKVLSSMKTGTKNIYRIDTMAGSINCTDNHMFLIRTMKHVSKNRERFREFSDPKWVACKDLNKSCYLGFPINRNSIIPEWGGIDFIWTDGRKNRHKNDLSPIIDTQDFWYIVGRYLGDGWERTQGGIIICCSKDNELYEITEKLDKCHFKYNIVEERTVFKIHVPTKEISFFMRQFGKYAYGKRLPGFIFDMPNNLLKSLLDGYLESDGYFNKNEKLFKVSSISKELIYGMSQIVAKVYKTPSRIYEIKKNKFCVIEGRVCNQHNDYELIWKIDKRKQDKAFYENGYIWYPIRRVTDTKRIEDVYDIEVQDNHSFIANNAIAHNCTDLSCSGLRAGMKKGSGTRSGLLWEIERLLTETKELPQILVMENVIQVHNPKNMPDFQLWLNFLESKGYKNFYADLNAKDFNLAQNRIRCFMVSVLGDYTYTFPKGSGLTKTLDDYLEDEVDASYYLEPARQDAMIRDLKDRIGTTIVEDFYQTVRGNRYYQETAPTLRAERHGLKVICASRGRIIENKELRVNESSTWTQQLEPNKCGTTNTLTTVAKDNLLLTGSNGDYTVRSLTPKECWRFMGYSDEDYEKAASVCTPTKLYKQAGNAIALPVMEAVFKELI